MNSIKLYNIHSTGINDAIKLFFKTFSYSLHQITIKAIKLLMSSYEEYKEITSVNKPYFWQILPFLLFCGLLMTFADW